MTPTAKSLILDLLSITGEGDAAVAGLVSAGDVFDIPGGSIRVALTRLSAAGLVESPRRGVYRLGRSARALRDQVQRWRNLEHRVRPWDGGWVGASTSGIAARDRASARALRLLGVRTLEPGLALRPDNLAGGVEEARLRLAALGVDLPVFRVTHLDPNRAELAHALWDTRRIEQSYRAMLQRLDEETAALPSRSANVAARHTFLAGGDAIRLLIFDPLLPAPLVDVGLRHALVDAMRRFDELGREAWTSLFAELRAAPFCVGLPEGAR